jgi:hypothetical protein
VFRPVGEVLEQRKTDGQEEGKKLIKHGELSFEEAYCPFHEWEGSY